MTEIRADERLRAPRKRAQLVHRTRSRYTCALAHVCIVRKNVCVRVSHRANEANLMFAGGRGATPRRSDNDPSVYRVVLKLIICPFKLAGSVAIIIIIVMRTGRARAQKKTNRPVLLSKSCTAAAPSLYSSLAIYSFVFFLFYYLYHTARYNRNKLGPAA